MILYFSGTGNSQFVAQQIAQRAGDELVSINGFLKQGRKDTLVSKTQPFVFVCPTYAWRIPRVVEECIKNTPFEGEREVYFVLTCGGETANAIRYVKALCTYKNWKLKGFAEVVMQDNYIVMFPAIDKTKAKALNQKAEELVVQIADDICQKKEFSIYADKGTTGKLESGVVNGMFYRFFVNAKGFRAEKSCVGCGQCAALCPMNNIKLQEKRPVWGNRCTHCMACICGCPAEAIEYKHRTQGKPRYRFSDFRSMD